MNYRVNPQMGINFDELVVDNFAGGGGAATGIEMALGRPVDIAINNDPQAIGMHTVNHPCTRHYCEDVWQVDPRAVTQGQPVGLAWFSPDCTHHSKARGGKPTSPRVRGLAWVALRWAGLARPRVIMLENVEEFEAWGPLTRSRRPCNRRKGMTFEKFVGQLRDLGYQVEWKQLRACDYGAPTIRKRLFLIARCDGQPIVWPEPTHGPGLKPYRTAADIIDWSLPCPSIFERKRPLADNTLRRIAKGLQRYVIDTPNPYIVNEHHAGQNNGHPELVAAFLAKHYTGVVGHGVQQPIGNITQRDHHSLVSAYLLKYYGNERDGISLQEPLHTIPTRDRFGLVTVRGEHYRIADIGMRMLAPHELFAAQGFPADYIIDRDANGQPINKTQQVAKCGNSVCPPMSAALVTANMQNAVQTRAAA